MVGGAVEAGAERRQNDCARAQERGEPRVAGGAGGGGAGKGDTDSGGATAVAVIWRGY